MASYNPYLDTAIQSFGNGGGVTQGDPLGIMTGQGPVSMEDKVLTSKDLPPADQYLREHSKKNTPPPPDYSGAAQQQAQEGQKALNQQTQANRPNINTPYASQQWSQGPDGQWRMQTGFAGQMGDLNQSLQGQAMANASRGLDNGTAARDQAIQGAYGQATSRLDPQWQQRQEQMGAQLANQGLDPSSQAYQQAMGDFNRNRNDAYSSAMNGAISQGTAAQQATFGENLAAYNNPFQQMQGMHSLLSMPGFNSAGVAPTPNYLGAAEALGNYNLNKSTADNAMAGDIAQGTATAAAAVAAAASDERVKHDIHRLPVEAAPGVPLATFRYNHAPEKQYVGVIAQDLERVAPQHVREGPDGVKRVSPQFSPFLFK